MRTTISAFGFTGHNEMSRQTKPTTITKALELGYGVRQEEAYKVLTQYSRYATDLKEKNIQQFSKIKQDTAKLRYKDLTKEQKVEGGVLFKTLEKINSSVDLTDVWPLYGLLVNVVMYFKSRNSVKVSVNDTDKDDDMSRNISSLLRKVSNPKTAEQYGNLLRCEKWYKDTNKTEYNRLKSEYNKRTFTVKDINQIHRRFAPDLFHVIESKTTTSGTALREYALLAKMYELELRVHPDKTKSTQEGEKHVTQNVLKERSKTEKHLVQQTEVENRNLKPTALQASKHNDIQQVHPDKGTQNGIPYLLRECQKTEKDKYLLQQAEEEYRRLKSIEFEALQLDDIVFRRERWMEHGVEGQRNYIMGLGEPTQPLHVLLTNASQRCSSTADKAMHEYGLLLFTESLMNSKDTPNVRPASVGSPQTPVSYHQLIKLQQEYDDLQVKSRYQESQIEELTTRLSEFASKQLSNANPNIADLSDKNRPTKIGENFGLFFDDEWSEAFEILKNDMSSRDIYCLFAEIVRDSFDFCEHAVVRHKVNIKDELQRLATEPKVSDKGYKTESKVNKALEAVCSRYTVEFTKESAPFTIPALSQIYKDNRLTQVASKVDRKYLFSKQFSSFVDKAVELSFLMCVQDPPMKLLFAKQGSAVSKDNFKLFKQSGKIVDICVWPALQLHENGPLVMKGHVQGK